MERKKLIGDKSSRRSAFSKRRNGLMKKARELSALYGVDVALVVVSGAGRRYEFSCGDSLANIVQRYDNCPEAKGKVQTASSNTEMGSASRKTCFELLQTVERQLEEPYLEQLDVPDLLQLEEQIGDALAHTRSIKTQLTLKPVQDLQEKEKALQEENNCLMEELAASNTGGDEEATSYPPEQPLKMG